MIFSGKLLGIFGIFGLIFAILPHLLISIYIYKDAKVRDINYPILWALMSFFIPYYIGALFYILINKSRKMIKCPNCKNETDATRAYCSSCGTDISEIETKENLSGPKGLLITAVVLIVVQIVLFIGFFVSFNYFGRYGLFGDEISKVTTSKYTESDKSEFKFKNETYKHVMKLDFDDYNNLEVDYKVNKGKVELEFYKNAELKKSAELSGEGEIQYSKEDLKDLLNDANNDNKLNIIVKTENATGEVEIEAN